MPTYKIIGGDQKQYGPVSAEEMRQWIAEGRLSGYSLALAEGSTEWTPLTAFPEFAAALSAQTAARPPVAAAPADSTQTASQILAREPELRIGECLSGGFSFLASNAGFVFGAVFVVWLLKTVMMFTPFIGGIAHWLLGGVLMGGLYLACLRRQRGEPASVMSVFDGFKLCFVQLMLAGALTKLLEQIGLAICFLPGIYLLVAWLFALPLVADKRLEFWSAMQLSRKVVNRVWFEVFLLMVITFLPLLIFQIYSTVKVWALLMDIFRNADLDPVRLMAAIREHMGEIIKMSVQVAVIGQVVLLFNMFYAVGVVVRAYENLFVLGKREGLTRQTARGCVGTNLALPGFGSLLAGRPVGYAQAAFTVVGFGLTMLFGVKAITWFLSHWSVIYGPEAGPVETMTGVWRETRWVWVGIALFAVAWLWSLTTNAAILRSALPDDDARKPPKLN